MCDAEAKHYLPIHREAPAFADQGTEQEILITGIKVCITHSTRRLLPKYSTSHC